MVCDVTDGELAVLSAGDIEPDRARDMEQHVAQCRGCRRRLEALARADAALGLLPRLEPPARAILDVRRALAQEVRGADQPEIMTLDEVADYLRLPSGAFDEIAGELPAFELAGQIRIRRAKLIEWIEEHEQRYKIQTTESDVARITAVAFGKGVA